MINLKADNGRYRNATFLEVSEMSKKLWASWLRDAVEH